MLKILTWIYKSFCTLVSLNNRKCKRVFLPKTIRSRLKCKLLQPWWYCLKGEPKVNGKRRNTRELHSAANKPAEYHYHATTREHAYFGIEFQPICIIASTMPLVKVFARMYIFENMRRMYANVFGKIYENPDW